MGVRTHLASMWLGHGRAYSALTLHSYTPYPWLTNKFNHNHSVSMCSYITAKRSDSSMPTIGDIC